MLQLLFSFKGRINRAKMWLVAALTSVGLSVPIAIGLIVLEETMIGADPRPTNLGPAASVALWFWVIFVLYIVVAAVVKRLHDRGKSAAWLLLFYGIPIAVFAAAFFIGWPPREIFPGASTAMFAFFAIAFANNIWYLLEIFAFRGTSGDNRFGPDPLATKQ